MAHKKKKQSTGNYKSKRDRHEKKNHTSDKKRKQSGWKQKGKKQSTV